MENQFFSRSRSIFYGAALGLLSAASGTTAYAQILSPTLKTPTPVPTVSILSPQPSRSPLPSPSPTPKPTLSPPPASSPGPVASPTLTPIDLDPDDLKSLEEFLVSEETFCNVELEEDSDTKFNALLKSIPSSETQPVSTTVPPPAAPDPREKSLDDYLVIIANKPVCPTGRRKLFNSEARCFAGYRAQAAAAFYYILSRYHKGEITKEQFRAEMKTWYDSYRQRYANCGERSKLSGAIAAYLGYESYNCTRFGGDHEFTLIVRNGQLCLIEPWPDNGGDSLKCPVTLEKDGKSIQPPLDGKDLSGFNIVRNGEVLDTVAGCNIILKAADVSK